MEEADKGWMMPMIGVSRWMFLLVPAYLSCPGQNPESRKTIVCVCVCVCVHMRACTCASCTSYWIHGTFINKCLHHFVHATLYTTTFPVYSLLKTGTLHWIITNASTTDTTWPSYSLLLYLLVFPTNHNLDLFIFTLMPVSVTKSSRRVCNPAYSVPVPSQDK